MRYAQSLVVCALLGASDPGYAQSGQVAGFGGLPFSLSGEYSINIHRSVELFGSFSYMHDVRTPELNRAALEIYAPRHSAARPHLRLYAVTTGARLTAPVQTNVKPYVLGGLGWSHGDLQFSSSVAGDLTGLALARTTSEWTTFDDPFGEAGAGVVFTVGQAMVDVGYRYGHPMHNDAPHISRVMAGVGVRFGD